MSEELTSLPESFAAGTTVSYRKSFSDYPASEWTFTLYLAGASILTIEAVADGDDFVVTISASETEQGFEAGLYKWAERVSNDSDEVYEVASGRVIIKPNLAQSKEGGDQEWVEVAIVALKSHIQGRLPKGMESYQIAGRAVSKIPIKDAMILLSQLETRLAQLKKTAGVGITRKILTRFTPIGYES